MTTSEQSRSERDGGVDPEVRRWLTEGLRHQVASNFSGASLAYRRVLQVDPEQIDALANLGGCYRELDRHAEAVYFTAEALARDPANLAAQCNQGALLVDEGRFEDALKVFSAVLTQDPGSFPARFHIAGVLFRLGRWEEALGIEQKMAENYPENCAVQSNLGFILMRLGRLEEARRAILRALEFDPEFAVARWNLAYVNLLDGRWEEAWPHFAFRMKIREGIPNLRFFDVPEWEGESFPGKRLLVWAEQGFGDTIQFTRFLPEVKRRGGEVVLQVQPALLPLLQGLPGVDLLLGEHEAQPTCDLHCSLLSLFSKLRVTAPGVAAVEPMLELPAGYQPTAEIQAMLPPGNAGVRIGLAWTGNPAHRDQAFRSLDPVDFLPLAGLGEVTWYSFQKFAPGVAPTSLPKALQAVDLSAALGSFAETAWALQRMHLVITADTSVAHLAGSLGIPTFLLLPVSPDWRWMQQGERTPWYPSFRIYRQGRLGDWAAVIAQVRADLQGGGC